MEILKNDSRFMKRLTKFHPCLDLGLFSRSCGGEIDNGDRAAVIQRDGHLLAVLFDGLGHGPKASQAACLAVHICENHIESVPSELLSAVNEGLRNTVGAAGAVLRMEMPKGELPFSGGSSLALCYCAVGNISARMVGDGVTRLIGIDGVLGAFKRKLRDQTALVGPGGLILLNSDGVQTDSLPKDLGASAMDLAKAMVEGFGRPHDDATALVIKVASQ